MPTVAQVTSAAATGQDARVERTGPVRYVTGPALPNPPTVRLTPGRYSLSAPAGIAVSGGNGANGDKPIPNGSSDAGAAGGISMPSMSTS